MANGFFSDRRIYADIIDRISLNHELIHALVIVDGMYQLAQNALPLGQFDHELLYGRVLRLARWKNTLKAEEHMKLTLPWYQKEPIAQLSQK